jgi:hypothetical protein
MRADGRAKGLHSKAFHESFVSCLMIPWLPLKARTGRPRADDWKVIYVGVTQLAVFSFPCHHDSRSNPPPARGGQANESTQVG